MNCFQRSMNCLPQYSDNSLFFKQRRDPLPANAPEEPQSESPKAKEEGDPLVTNHGYHL